MAKVTSNADDIADWLDELASTFDFNRPGVDGSLGRDCAGTAAQGMIDRTVAEVKSADGGNLKPNERKYAVRKLKKYDANQPLVRSGQLLSLTSMRGETAIEPDKVTMQYGTNQPPAGSLNGYLPDADRKVTDRQKAGWVSDERPFYALDETIGDTITAMIDEALADHLQS